MNRLEELQSNFQKVNSKINLLCEQRESKPLLIAVTKYSESSDLKLTYELGYFDMGENRLDVLLEKDEALNPSDYPLLNWHFIGNLQSNKIKKLLSVSRLKSIHSVDSLKLLKKILSQEQRVSSSVVELFLQVNTSGEVEKQGLENLEEIKECFEYFRSYQESSNSPKFKLSGLMTMGKIRSANQREDAKKCFEDLRDLASGFENLKLSMGMSGDYDIAVDQGADIIRVGSILFK